MLSAPSLPCFTIPVYFRPTGIANAHLCLQLFSAWPFQGRKHLQFTSTGPYWTKAGVPGPQPQLVPWNLSYTHESMCQVPGRTHRFLSACLSQPFCCTRWPLSLVSACDVPHPQLVHAGPWCPHCLWVPGASCCFLHKSWLHSCYYQTFRHLMSWGLLCVHRIPLNGTRARHAGDSSRWASPAWLPSQPQAQ